MPKKPGRKGAADLTVISFTPGQRLQPPSDLSPRQAEAWRAIVASKPADWFDAGNGPLLAEYVRVADAAGVLATLVEKASDAVALATDDGLRRLTRLIDAQGRQAKLALVLARSMRLSQHSTKRADAAATNTKLPGRRPWEIGQDDEPA